MTEKIRFGIVGCGVIGPVHAEAIASLPDAELISVVDINPEQAQRLASQYGAKPYTQLQRMLGSEPVDVVIICTPSGLHGQLACQA
ncbi:MAG TPA: Gfo/Idh/MocA family oxidoreductase, partial [Ktedonobacteraceae bacterium]|nr:Gfo/Idh/MocA family oxidoreductase [Ktedonobacteraceae bacterium]